MRKETLESINSLTPESHVEAVQAVLDAFVNPGESCLSISPQNVLESSKNISKFDVFFVHEMGKDDEYWQVANKVLTLVKKRAIFAIKGDLLEKWKMYMAAVPYHWESYEYGLPAGQKEGATEYYIIDKAENQQTLATQIVVWSNGSNRNNNGNLTVDENTNIEVTEVEQQEVVTPDAGVADGEVLQTTDSKGKVVEETVVYDYDENGEVIGWHKEVV